MPYGNVLLKDGTNSLDLLALISLALGTSWASGINLYAAVAVIGLLNAFNIAELPEAYSVLSDPIVLGVAIFMFAVEFFADKIPGFDSLWDTVHTFLRVPAGALMAAGAVSDVGEPVQIAAALIAGGTVALGSHATKAGGRVMINASPEPVSNWIASFLEDVLVIMGLLLAVFKPAIFLVMFGLFLLFAMWLVPKAWRGCKALFDRLRRREEPVGREVDRPAGFDLTAPKE